MAEAADGRGGPMVVDRIRYRWWQPAGSPRARTDPWRRGRATTGRPGTGSGRGYRQLSFSVTAPVPAVYARFGSLSQVTEPSGFFLMYLYWNAVLAGSDTVATQVG